MEGIISAWHQLEFEKFNNRLWVNEFMVLSISNFGLACVGTWSIWGDCNKVVQREILPSSTTFPCEWIMDYLRTFSGSVGNQMDGSLGASFLSPVCGRLVQGRSGGGQVLVSSSWMIIS